MADQIIRFRQTKDGAKREDVAVVTPDTLPEEIMAKVIAAFTYDVAKDYLDENPEETSVPESVFSLESLIEYLSSGRKSSVPSDEELEAFAEAYKTVMPIVDEKSEKRNSNAAEAFKAKLGKFARAEDHLMVFRERLDVFETLSQEHTSVVAFLRKRIIKCLEKLQAEKDCF